jgi:probable phosphoglycerate mutase
MSMETTRLIAIRHGETAWNVDTRIQGQLDIGLNEHGHWQARQAARALAEEPIAAIYSSDLSRAFDTARAIGAAVGLSPEPHQGLRERAFGIFEGRTWAEIETNWPDDTRRWRDREPGWAPSQGETLEQVRDRVALATEALAARHRGEQIVLVAHGGVMDALYRLATQQHMQAPRTWSLGNAAINRLLWSPQGLTLVGWGDTRHLEDAALDESST